MKNKLLVIFFLLVFVVQCSKDDEADSFVIRDYNEQVQVDQELLENFMQTHTYNYEDFNNQLNVDIKIDTIMQYNSSKLSLFDLANIQTIDVQNSEGESISHNLYYIIAREGSNQNISIVDSVYVAYEGKLIDGFTFDKSKFPIWLDMANTIEGFREGVSKLKTGFYDENQDGTISYKSFGVGLFFLPSGIGYYENSTSTLPEYSPLIFSVKLMSHTGTDHDNDGIKSILEDIDGDGKPFGDDTDGDNLWNMYDSDDDGDGILTIDEIDKDNDLIIDDTDNDGVPDYLDPKN